MKTTSTQLSKIHSWCENEIGCGIFLGVEKRTPTKKLFFSDARAHLFDKDQNRIGTVGARENPKPFKLFDWSTWRRSYPIRGETLMEAIERQNKEDGNEVKFVASFHFAPEQPFMFDDFVAAYKAYVYEL
jgi:hypothetical protein